MSQQDAQLYRSAIRTKLGDELVTHDRATCQYCSVNHECPELDYAQRADDIVERRLLRRRAGGPS